MSVISTARLLLSMLGILNGEANYHVFIFYYVYYIAWRSNMIFFFPSMGLQKTNNTNKNTMDPPSPPPALINSH